MGLVLGDGEVNAHLTITNGSGGASSTNSIAIAFAMNTDMTQGLAGTFANIMRDALAPLLDSGWTFGPTHFVENDDGVRKVWDDTGTEAGTHAAAVYASPAVSHVVSKFTGLSGREHRGRFYFPGVPEADVDESGTLDGARVNAVTAAFEDMRTDLVAEAAITFCLLLHDSESPAASSDVILAYACRPIVGTMRPRQRR